MQKKFLIPIIAFLLLNVTNSSYAQADEKLVILHTMSGDIVIEFFPNDAPNHVKNFLELTESGFYDRTIFHRIIEDFMIQGGDPKTKPGGYKKTTEWGTGGPGHSIDSEFNTIKHSRGIVSMARGADPNSAGSQFFIVHKDSNFLDEEYTVFGRLATQESFETLDKIASLETIPGGDIPLQWGQTEILRAEVVDRSQVPNLLVLGDTEMNSEGGGCLIATATFGSELSPQVQKLRETRDNSLLQTEAGSAFMESFNQFYYSFSPTIADLERENPLFKETVKIAITPLLTSLSILNYVEFDSEETVLGFGIGLILLNVGMYFIAPTIIISRIFKRQ